MSSVDAPLFTDPAHLAKLKSEAHTGSSDNLREVARQFESMFTHMLMKNMRAASLGEGAFDSDQSRFYQDMFDQQMSTELTRGKGLGIAELLVRQLGGDESTRPESPNSAGFATPIRNKALVTAQAPVRSETVADSQTPEIVRSERKIDGPIDFVKSALPHARRVGELLGVAPQLVLAQAALETGWGQKMIRNTDGSSSHNLFGIKTGSKWDGSSAMVNTLEFASGVGQRVKAAFRSYGSMAESFDDYAKLLLNNPRYQDVIGSGDDSARFAGALKRSGYATDPDYATKIMRIVDGDTLNNAIKVTSQGDK